MPSKGVSTTYYVMYGSIKERWLIAYGNFFSVSTSQQWFIDHASLISGKNIALIQGTIGETRKFLRFNQTLPINLTSQKIEQESFEGFGSILSVNPYRYCTYSNGLNATEENTNIGYYERWADTSGHKTVYWSSRWYKVNSSGYITDIVTGSTAGVSRYPIGEGYQNGSWTHSAIPIASSDHIRLGIWQKIGTETNYEVQTWNTEDLGYTQLDAGTTNTTYYVGLDYFLGYTLGYIIWGYQTGESSYRLAGVLNLSYSMASVDVWNLVASMSHNLNTGSWNLIVQASDNLLTRAWNLVASISDLLVVGSWNQIGIVSYNLKTPFWNLIASFSALFNVAKWNLIGYTWDLLIPPSGVLVKAWLIMGAMFLGIIFIGIVAYTQRRKLIK